MSRPEPTFGEDDGELYVAEADANAGDNDDTENEKGNGRIDENNG